MSRVTLALTGSAYSMLVATLAEGVETAFVAWTGAAEDETGVTLFLRNAEAVPDECYLERTSNRLVIASAGFMPAFGLAESHEAGAAFIHTHPGGRAEYSELDDRVDEELSAVARCRTDSPFYVSMIIAGSVEAPSFVARVVSAEGTRSVDVIRVAGERFRLIRLDNDELEENIQEHFDRQIRVFGDAGQRVLSALRIGIVGVGGTGSAVCEQLVRLGVGEVLLVDDDTVTESNVTRIYGSTPADVGKHKVSVLTASMAEIDQSTRVTPVVGRVTDRKIAERLRQCDVIFGCTDDQWGRSVLSRLAYFYLIPMIDLAVVITSDGRRVHEIVGRVTVIGPGSACLLCRGRIQPEVIRAEALPTGERERLAAEGYVQGFAQPDPSVVTYTSLIASLGTSEFLSRLFGLGTLPYATELLFRIDLNELRRNTVASREGHFCADASKWGVGDSEPFLDMLWS